MLPLLKRSLSLFLILFSLSCSNDDASEDSLSDDTNEENIDEIINTDETDTSTDTSEENENADEIISTDETDTSTDTNEDDEVATVLNSAVATYGQLSIDGNNIVNKNGDPTQLRGMSLFWSQWDDGSVFYNANTIKWLKADWHATIVRAAMGTNEGDGAGYIINPETEKAKVFAVIDAAIEEGIYVIVDWHSHNAENQLDRAKEFFTEVAQKYGDYPNIIYEIYNEPVASSIWNSVLKPYHEAVIAEIRKYDSDNIIVCGTGFYSQEVDDVIGNEINDDNVAYTLHYYASTHLQNGSVWEQAVKAINAGIPLFVTEFGVTEASGNGSINMQQAEIWWDFLDEHKISWCNWSITNKAEASAALNSNTTASSLSVDNLTTSGQMVYDEMISKNTVFE